MALLQSATKYAVVLRSYASLGARDDHQRRRAMAALLASGDAAEWCLQIAVRQGRTPRVQFAAAIVLHWRGDPQGLKVIIEALKWRLAAEPLIAVDRESALVTIGSPHAVAALLNVWNMLPDQGDHEAVRASICRVWAALKDPTVLPALSATALLNSTRFEHTTSAFGELAVPTLKRMGADADPARRALAVQSVRHVRSASATAVLVPMLSDSAASVRSLVPDALVRAGTRTDAIQAITAAVSEGYSSSRAVEMLVEARAPNLSWTLLTMLEALANGPEERAEAEVILLALPCLLAENPEPGRLVRVLCRLLHRRAEPGFTIALVSAVEAAMGRAPGEEWIAVESLTLLTYSANNAVRHNSAAALARLGDSFPLAVDRYLAQSRPQDSFLSQLQVLLEGGRDAGQAASQAVEQLSNWVARLTAEAGQRGTSRHRPAPNTIAANPRLVTSLRSMLFNALRSMREPQSGAHNEETGSFIKLLLHGIERLGMPAAAAAWPELVSAFHLQGASSEMSVAAQYKTSCQVTSAAAAGTLVAIYGSASFGLLLEAAYSVHPNIAAAAIRALGMIQETRALPHLRAMSANAAHPNAELALRTIAQIQRSRPEVISLLRASSATGTGPADLLRAASGRPVGDDAGLLRAATSGMKSP